MSLQPLRWSWTTHSFSTRLSSLSTLPPSPTAPHQLSTRRYLDSSYPVGPPLILDENAAYLLDQGFGNSDSGWSTMFELCAVAIADTMTEKVRHHTVEMCGG